MAGKGGEERRGVAASRCRLRQSKSNSKPLLASRPPTSDATWTWWTIFQDRRALPLQMQSQTKDGENLTTNHGTPQVTLVSSQHIPTQPNILNLTCAPKHCYEAKFTQPSSRLRKRIDIKDRINTSSSFGFQTMYVLILHEATQL